MSVLYFSQLKHINKPACDEAPENNLWCVLSIQLSHTSSVHTRKLFWWMSDHKLVQFIFFYSARFDLWISDRLNNVCIFSFLCGDLLIELAGWHFKEINSPQFTKNQFLSSFSFESIALRKTKANRVKQKKRFSFILELEVEKNVLNEHKCWCQTIRLLCVAFFVACITVSKFVCTPVERYSTRNSWRIWLSFHFAGKESNKLIN